MRLANHLPTGEAAKKNYSIYQLLPFVPLSSLKWRSQKSPLKRVTWRIVQLSDWFITMVIVSPLRIGVSLVINGVVELTTYSKWGDHPSFYMFLPGTQMTQMTLVVVF